MMYTRQKVITTACTTGKSLVTAALNSQPANAGPGEHELDGHRPHHQGTDDEGEVGEGRDGGVAEAVFPNDLPLRYALDARQFHVFGIQDVQHGRAHKAQ